jgi:sulfoxide reductase heme-binding subunit YedZ
VKDPRFAKFVLVVNGFVPAVLLAWNAQHHQLGADTVGFCQDATGFIALILLLLTLCVTPLRKLTGYNYLSHFRKTLGLFAFFYAMCHFAIYFVIQRGLSFSAAIRDISHNYFIVFGLIGLVVMIPLALTSTTASIRRLGAKRWKLLHRLVYVAAVAGVIHYYFRFKTVHDLPIILGAILAVLLLSRIPRPAKPKPAAHRVGGA